MGQIWIINVLTDLKNFASLNELPELARQLEETARVAAVEIAETTGESSLGAQRDGIGTRTVSGTGGTGTRIVRHPDAHR